LIARCHHENDLLGIVPPGVLAGLMGTDATATGVTQTPDIWKYSFQRNYPR